MAWEKIRLTKIRYSERRVREKGRTVLEQII